MFLTVQVEVREERSAALGETHWEVMGTIVTRARISSTSRVEVESFENILISLNVWGAIIDAVEVSQAACGVWKYGTAPPIYINYSGSWRWSYFRIAQIIGKWWARGKTGHFTSLSSLSGVPQLYLGWEQPCIFRQSHVTSTAVVSFDLIILMTWRSRCCDPDHTSTRRICFQVRDTTLLQWHQISIYPRLTGQVLLDVSWCFLMFSWCFFLGIPLSILESPWMWDGTVLEGVAPVLAPGKKPLEKESGQKRGPKNWDLGENSRCFSMETGRILKGSKGFAREFSQSNILRDRERSDVEGWQPWGHWIMDPWIRGLKSTTWPWCDKAISSVELEFESLAAMLWMRSAGNAMYNIFFTT